MACSTLSDDSRSGVLASCSCNSAAKPGKKASLRPCKSVCRLSLSVTRKIWLIILSDQSSRDSGACRLAGGMEGAGGRLTSGPGEERFVLRFVPGAGDDPPVDPTPSCVKGFAAAGDWFPDAAVMLILVRLTSGGFSLASPDELGAGGLAEAAACDAWLPSPEPAGGAFVDPSFSRRRRRIYTGAWSVSIQHGRL